MSLLSAKERPLSELPEPGEQGRGFAVVAGEAGSLAQRSGEAAKEIRTLIAERVNEVGVGSGLVNQAGSAMEDIVEQVKRVADLIGEISRHPVNRPLGLVR